VTKSNCALSSNQTKSVSLAHHGLDNLGFEDFQIQLLRQALARPVGALIVAGTCGSGVSTTLHSLLVEKFNASGHPHESVNVERHDELHLNDPAAPPGLSRIKTLLAALRSDPETVHVGELRDEASALAVLKLIQSGHQVITETHASGALDIPTRLKSMGMSREFSAEPHTLSALVYQTLIPVVCPHCAMDLREAQDNAEKSSEQEQLARIAGILHPSLHEGLRFRREGGCDQCLHGTKGRTAVGEVVIPDEGLRACLREERHEDWIRHFRKQGGILALEHGVSKALRGMVDLRDVECRLDQLVLLAELAKICGDDEPFVLKADPLAQYLSPAA
jgi:type II secretory ATPase GspE/PulE/Tfp pilus assembly ATPase PilB-like protein